MRRKDAGGGAVGTSIGQIRTADTTLAVEEQGDKFVIRGFASKPVVDRLGEIIEATAYADLLPRYLKNPVMLWGHDPRQVAGHFTKVEPQAEGLYVEGEIGKGFQPADTVRELIRQGHVKAMSIGFREIEGSREEDGRYHIRKLDLYEISVVAVPANQDALFEFSEGEGGKRCLSAITLGDESKTRSVEAPAPPADEKPAEVPAEPDALAALEEKLRGELTAAIEAGGLKAVSDQVVALAVRIGGLEAKQTVADEARGQLSAGLAALMDTVKGLVEAYENDKQTAAEERRRGSAPHARPSGASR